MKTPKIIDSVAAEAPKEWKVDLKNPNYTVVVEIVKTLFGMSIVEDCPQQFGKFNLIELQEKVKKEEGKP